MAIDLKDPMNSAAHHATAQKFANAAWGWGITAAVCYYFWGWKGAALPLVLMVGSVWESTKATRKALKWEKLEAMRSANAKSSGSPSVQ